MSIKRLKVLHPPKVGSRNIQSGSQNMKAAPVAAFSVISCSGIEPIYD